MPISADLDKILDKAYESSSLAEILASECDRWDQRRRR